MTDDMKLREIPICDETVFRGRLINVSHMQVKLPDGREAFREIVHHNGAAAIVPVDENGDVFLVRQHRVAVDAVMLEIPAGKRDTADENPLHCAIRELEEETGLRAESMRELNHVITTPGFCTETIWLYLATGLSQHRYHRDQDEFMNVIRMPLAEAVERVMRGEISDAKTVAGLMMAARILGV